MSTEKAYAQEVTALFNTKADPDIRIRKTLCYRGISERAARIKALLRRHCIEVESVTPMTQAETEHAYGIVQRM